MPKSHRPAPLYQRGKFALHARAGRNLEIIWYDEGRGRERSVSARTTDVQAAREALDRLYLQTERGENICPTCGQPRRGEASQFIASAIADYLVLAADKPSIEAIRARLARITTYLQTLPSPAIRCLDVDEGWIERFRKWASRQTVGGASPSTRTVSAGTVENSVLQLAAVINAAHRRHATPFPAAFRPRQPKDVNRTPHFRADLDTLAAMFAHAAEPGKRRGALLAFLQISVATWCRPDAAMDFDPSPAKRQWIPAARAIALNPDGRPQTRKFRPTVPAPRQIVPVIEHHLRSGGGPFVPVESVRTAWRAMARAIGLDAASGEAGMKLVRRSMATLARERLGEEHWAQGRMMLGHAKSSVSDVYALPDPAHLGRALAVTESIIAEIEARTPTAFTATLPRAKPKLIGIPVRKSS